jgi:putative glutamine amidotransferase
MNQKRPVIAIICNQDIPDNPDEAIYNDVSQRYTTAILNAGGLPVLIPDEFPPSEIQYLRDTYSGVFLIGGGDVAVERFFGKVHPSISAPNHPRDILEIEITKHAVETSWPILGICRGIQTMNVALGGSLYTDIADQVPGTIHHSSPKGTPRNQTIHSVQFDPQSRLEKIYGKSSLNVNSFHHQAISKIASAFSPVGMTPDGLIEAVEIPDHPFAIGVQWHPECMQDDPDQIKLFSAFINACHTS